MGRSVEETRIRSDPSSRWEKAKRRGWLCPSHTLLPEVSGVSQGVKQHQSLPEMELNSLG